MIQLNGVQLNDSLIWEDEFDASTITQNEKRVILGNFVVQTMPLFKGNQITLTAVSSGSSFIGSFTREQIIEFKSLEQNKTVIPFVYESFTAQVIVKAQGVNMKPIFDRPNRNSADLYTGTLILIEV